MLLVSLTYCVVKNTTFLCFPRNACNLFHGFRRFVSSCSCSSSVMDSFSSFGLYRNLETILFELTDSKHNGVTEVQELLQVFNQAKKKFEEADVVKKYPLIIMEGLDGSGKSAMTKRLASKFQAEKWLTPPESIRYLRQFFDDHALKSAYYSLGNYIAALEVSSILSTKPVVMDRYWHSTTAYALAQGVADNPNKLTLPHAKDDVYKWPSDLLKPDIVLLLSVNEEVRLERHSRRRAETVTTQEKLLKDDTKFRQDVLQAYKNISEPAVVIDGNGSFGRTLHLLKEKVEPLVNKLV